MGDCYFFHRLVVWICVTGFAVANVQSKVRCSEETMEVDIVRSSPQAVIYLEQFRDYPDEACQPQLRNGVATFKLSLLDDSVSRCGTTRVVNKDTGQKVYYHRIIVEEPIDSSKHTFIAKCLITEVKVPGTSRAGNHTVLRRSVLPAGFQEPDVIDIIDESSGMAPTPNLSVGVRQGGNLVTGQLNVSPGTPLQMEIHLDPESAQIYGLLVTHMQVTDTKTQEETIIFNGCSVDPYLFENFNTIDGDFLNAKFRAFKFPESTYVKFVGTVNVCLDKCPGIECSNGQVGYGRKRRSVSGSKANELYEVSMVTMIKVDFEGDATVDRARSEFIRRGKNITEAGRVVEAEIGDRFKYVGVEDLTMADQARSEFIRGQNGAEARPVVAKEMREQFIYDVSESRSNEASRNFLAFSTILIYLSWVL